MSYFTYGRIMALLGDLDRRFGLFPLGDFRNQPGIILRHDIDLDPEPALRLAERQAEQGIRGSFFVLATGHTYNPQSARNRAIIRRLADLGMEVALHFDPSIYALDAPEELGRLARHEAAVLEEICGKPIVSVSLHNPSVTNQYPLLPGWLNAYDPRIFAPEIYLSDSRMKFAHDPATFFEGAAEQTHQLTLHPLHYDETTPEYPRPFLDYLRRAAGELDKQFSKNSTYAERVGHRFFDMLRDDVQSWGGDSQ